MLVLQPFIQRKLALVVTDAVDGGRGDGLPLCAVLDRFIVQPRINLIDVNRRLIAEAAVFLPLSLNIGRYVDLIPIRRVLIFPIPLRVVARQVF